MNAMWHLLFLFCPIAATVICARLAPRVAWWWIALLGGTIGLAAYWGIAAAVAGHLDKFFLLAIVPQALLSLGISALTAFVVSGLKR